MTAAADKTPSGPGSAPATAESAHRAGRRSRYVVRRLIAVLAVISSAALASVWIFLRNPQAADLPDLDLNAAAPDVQAAIADAREAVIEKPGSARAWGNLAMLLLAHDFSPEANHCFAEAERLDPRAFRWPYLRGVSLAVTDRWSALDCYRRAVELRGDSVLARLRLAELLIELGRLDEATIQLDAALKLDPADARAALGLARLAYRRNDLKESLNWAQASAARAPMKRGTHELLARIHHRLGDRDAAAEQLAILKDIPEGETTWPDPLIDEVLGLRQDPDSTLIRAHRLLEQGRASECVTMLEELVAEHPAVAKYHYELGRALLAAGENGRAGRRLDRGIELHPGSAEMHRLRGAVHYSDGEWQAAAERFRRTIELKPDDSIAWYNLGHCLVRLNRNPDALAAFRSAVRLRPDSADAHTNVGKLLLRFGRRDEAVKHLRLATELAPNDAVAKNLLSEATAEQRQGRDSSK